jgi:hypothetical protein
MAEALRRRARPSIFPRAYVHQRRHGRSVEAHFPVLTAEFTSSEAWPDVRRYVALNDLFWDHEKVPRCGAMFNRLLSGFDANRGAVTG